MKFVHLSDLHLGKKLFDYSLIEDQAFILDEIISVIDKEKPDCVIIAGDVYDKSVPSIEAVTLFDDFLFKLSQRSLKTFVISGNHDSPERIAFGSRIMNASGIYLSPVYAGKSAPVKLEDEFGTVNVYSLPFIKPVHVRRFHPNEEIKTYCEALRKAITDLDIDESERNVLITHQFVTGSIRAESEDVTVGGSDNVDAEVFEAFDYVALGHLHTPQNCSSAKIRYCGSPLKYSFSEAKDQKSVTVVEIKEKGDLSYKIVPLIPSRDLIELKGSYEQLTARDFYYGKSYTTDYTHITLTDEDEVVDAIGKLRLIYKKLLKLDYDNSRSRFNETIEADRKVENKSPYELFAELYRMQNNRPLSEEQEEYLKEAIEKTLEEGYETD